MKIKTMAGWEVSNLGLSEYLQIGDRVDQDLKDYFLEVMPPIQGGGYVQIGEAYSHNDNGTTYATLFGNLYLGHLNNVRKFPAAAHGRRKAAERLAKKIEPLLFATTFAASTPESAEVGEYSSKGFLTENELFESFSDLVNRVKNEWYFYPSVSPNWEEQENLWVSGNPFTSCYATGEETTMSFHPKNARSLRYLKKALRACGVK